LTDTCAKPSRGHIKQVKTLLKHDTKSTLNLCIELAILGALMDEKDLTDKILDGLGDDYKELVLFVQACDKLIFQRNFMRNL